MPSPGGCAHIWAAMYIKSLRGCSRVQFCMSTAPVYGCHISILLGMYVCKIIAFVNFQEIKEIYIFIIIHYSFINLPSIEDNLLLRRLRCMIWWGYNQLIQSLQQAVNFFIIASNLHYCLKSRQCPAGKYWIVNQFQTLSAC